VLTRVVIDGCKVLCSSATEMELKELFAEARRQTGLAEAPADDGGDAAGLVFHVGTVGPFEVHFGERRYVLWGTPKELRFYTPEEFEVLREE
jgi:hypothetical protein